MADYDIQKIFEDMEDYLIKSMKRTLQYHVSWEEDEGFVWEQWQAKKLREIRKFQRRNREYVAVSRKKWNGVVNGMLKHQFLEGGRKTDKEFKSIIEKGFRIGRTTPNNDWFEGENNKIQNLIKAVNHDFDQASYAALRKMDDVYRQTIFKSVMFAGNGAMTPKQAIDMATKDFLEKGIDSITYKNGAKVNIASYAAMATKTANKRAHLMGEGDRRKEWGESLVLVSQYMKCSPLCLPWQGKVYIDDVYSGGTAEDGDYPLLSTAIKGHLYHPNCKHTQSTFFEDINEVPEPLLSESGEQYELTQEITEAKRNARKYERLKNGSLDEANVKKYTLKQKEWSNKQNAIINQAMPNIQIHKSIGAAAKNYPVRLPDGTISKLQEGTKITKVYTFAGKGTNKVIRVAKNLEKMYNIPISEWKKVRGDGYVVIKGKSRHCELHWYETKATGRVDMKVKRYFDEG